MEVQYFVALIIMVNMVGLALGLILGERQHRRAVLEEMREERHALKDALKAISETHNSLVGIQKVQGEMMEDLTQKVTFMVQGVKGK